MPSMALVVIIGITTLLVLCLQPAHAAFSCQGTCDDYDAQSRSYGGNVSIKVLAATNLPNKDSFGPFSKKSDPYVKIILGTVNGRTRTIPNSLNPRWNETVNLGFHLSKKNLVFEVWDADSGLEFADDRLGRKEMSLTYCSMFTRAQYTRVHCHENDWTYCTASGSAWLNPLRQTCTETGWVALDGGDDTQCGPQTSHRCLQVSITIVPFVVEIQQTYDGLTWGVTGGSTHANLVSTSWGSTFGQPFVGSTAAVINAQSVFGKLRGGILLQTREEDADWADDVNLVSLSMNFGAHMWVCREASHDIDYRPQWLESWVDDGSGVKLDSGNDEWRCLRSSFPATQKNQFGFMTSTPVYLKGNRPSNAPTMSRMYIVMIQPHTDDEAHSFFASWDQSFHRAQFWETVGEFGIIMAIFSYLVLRLLRAIELRLDRLETHMAKHATAGHEANVLGALFLSYHQTQGNVEFRRNLYYAVLATRIVVAIPLVILWTWGIVAVHNVNPPAVGYGIIFIGSTLIFGTYGYHLWRKMGWCMTSLAFYCLSWSAFLAMVFLVLVVFANPAVFKGGEPIDFRSLSTVFTTLNLIPLIFRAFTSDTSLARSINQLLATVGMAAKSVSDANAEQQTQGYSNFTVVKALERQASSKGEEGRGAKPSTRVTSPFNALLGACYTIHTSIPYFKYSDMVAVILKRCTGKAASMTRLLYNASVAILVVYAMVALESEYFPLAWLNLFTLLLLDLIHYLLGRGSNAWPPGQDVAILAGGRMCISVVCGKYWLVGYSLAYMIYGYALTDAIITRYLPHMSKAEAGAVAFFGSEDYLKHNFDIAASPVFCFGFLSFCFLALLLGCAFTKPATLPLPKVVVGGSHWPVYIFGIIAFLFILISCLTRATFRAIYLYNQNLLMGSFRDAFFWSNSMRVPLVLAVLTQVLVICSGLLIYAATSASIIFILSIFLPPILICLGYLYTQWVAHDYELVIWPPRLEVPKDDAPLEDDEVAYGMMGSYMGTTTINIAPKQAAPAFNIEGLQSTSGMSTTGSGQGGAGGFSLPPMVKTGKAIIGEIKMPALPLKANLKKKNDDEDGEGDGGGRGGDMSAATAYLGDEVTTKIPDGVPYPTGNESQPPTVAGQAAFGKKGHTPISRRRPRIKIWRETNPHAKRLIKAYTQLTDLLCRRNRKYKIAVEAAKLEEGSGAEHQPLVDPYDMSKVPFKKAFLDGYLTNEEYSLLFMWAGVLVFIFIMGMTIFGAGHSNYTHHAAQTHYNRRLSSVHQPYYTLHNPTHPNTRDASELASVGHNAYMGVLIWTMSYVLLFTVIPIIKWFNTYEVDRLMVYQITFSMGLFWLTLGVVFSTVLGHDLNNPGGVWLLTAFLGYPIVVIMAVRLFQWRDSGWRIVSLDEDGDGDVTVGEVVKYLNITPIFLAACVVLIWEVLIFGSRTLGVLLALAFALCLVGFAFLRDWAKNDFYLSPRYQMLGNHLVSAGMLVSLFVGLASNKAPLILCLSVFFFLYIMRQLTAIFARSFIMEPDVPIYISPYVFPIYSYTSRTNDLIEETVTGIKIYAVMMACIMWGICFAIFVSPQSLGITIACVSIVVTVVVTAVLIEQVPLALGKSSRFLDSSTILDAAETAKKIFDKRRKPVEFECGEWDEEDRRNSFSTQQRAVSEDQRKTAGELAVDLSTRLTSLRKIKNRRNIDKLHSEYLFSHKDALVEALVAGKGLFGAWGGGGVIYRCIKLNKKLTLLKDYDKDGLLTTVEKLKRKFDSQSFLLAIADLDTKIIHEFHEELRCVIHLWLLLIVAADARLRREKVLFQQFLRENRFKLLSNGIAPPKNIFSSASFASINISLVAVWLTTLTPEERERFHLLKSKFTEDQARRDAMVDNANAGTEQAAYELLARRRSREEAMCRKGFMEITSRRDHRLVRWVEGLPIDDQRKFQNVKTLWMKNAAPKVEPEDEALYKNFLENVTIRGGDEALVAARETLRELESAERNCKPGQFGRGYQFYDPDFPVGMSSLGKDCGISPDNLAWSVSLAMNADACLFEKGTDPDDVFKGKLNDGWLLSAISMLAAAGGVGNGGVDEQIQQLFVGFAGEDGKLMFTTSVGAYGVRLYKNGQWETVILDDFFPIIRSMEEDPTTRGAAFAYSKEFRELWVPLIEKAFAKYYGSYSELQEGHVHHALSDLTGCEAEEIFLSKASRGVGKRSLWDMMVRAKKNGFILGAGSVSSDLADRQILDTGLVFGAAYTVYDVRQVDDFQLIKLRNPPGDHEEWKGDWGDSSRVWTKRYKKKLGYSAVNDNTFWMSFDDFCIAFNSLYVCRWTNPQTWKQKVFHGLWKVGDTDKGEVDTSSGVPSKHNQSCELDRNPQYEIVTHRRTDLHISVSQKDASGVSPPEVHPMAAYLLNNTSKRKGTLAKEISIDNMYASTGAPVRERSLSLYTSLEPGRYILLCATYLPGMEGPFTVDMKSNFSIEVEQLWPPVWREQTLAEKLKSKAMAMAERAHETAQKELLGDPTEGGDEEEGQRKAPPGADDNV